MARRRHRGVRAVHSGVHAALVFGALALACDVGPPAADEAPSVGSVSSPLHADDAPSAETVYAVALDLELSPPEEDEAHRARVRAAQDSLLAALPAGEFEVARRFLHVPGLALRLFTPAARDAARAHPVVRGLGPDVAGGAHLDQSAVFLGVPAVHAQGLTGAGRRVAVVDTGADTDHPDLVGDLVDGACFCITNGGCCPGGTSTGLGLPSAEDDTGHGTHVSGIITSAGVVSPLGIAPDTDLVVVRVMRNGRFGSSSDIVAALDWIRVFHPTVDAVNLSLGTNALFPAQCEGASPGYVPPTFMANLDLAVQSLLQVGVLSVASSGNDTDKQRITAPACLSNTIAVGAVGNASNSVASFSNSNAGLDLWAPGVSIRSSFIGGTATNANGTSMATPHVVATVALAQQHNPAHPVATVEACLRTTSASAVDPANGIARPRLDVAAAVAACGPFPLGAACTFAAECTSGFCADGVCCNSACGGTATDCEVCAVAAGGTVDGQCTVASSGAVCRPSAGLCDRVEACNGASTACPADGFAAQGTSCRPAAGACDLPEVCTGLSGACPTDAKFGGLCRPAAGPSDRPESCNGVADTCPADELWGVAIACRPSRGDCDPAEMCTGTSTGCPTDVLRSDVCRPAMGACDVPEVCTGFSFDCPADARAGAGTLCRPGAGECDRPEACDGVDAECPADTKRTSVCRPAAGPCDVAEACDGTSDVCPADGLLAAGEACRPVQGDCDLAEACTGVSAECPADSKRVGVCRPAAGDCDVAERCDGVVDACPSDAVRTSTVVCRPAAGVCDAAERCDGTTGVCPADAAAADGTSCADDRACDGAETCQGGACVPGAAPVCASDDPCAVGRCEEPAGCVFTPVPGCCQADADCDDGDPCTVDACTQQVCAHTPSDACRAPPLCPNGAEGPDCDATTGCAGGSGASGGALVGLLLGLVRRRRRARCS